MEPRRSERLERRRSSRGQDGSAAPAFAQDGGFQDVGPVYQNQAYMQSYDFHQQQPPPPQQQQPPPPQQQQQQQYYQQQVESAPLNPYTAWYMPPNNAPTGSGWPSPYTSPHQLAPLMNQAVPIPMPQPQFPPFGYVPPFQPAGTAAPFFASPGAPFAASPSSSAPYAPPATEGPGSVTTRHKSTYSPNVPQPVAPVATQEYLDQSKLWPIPTASPQPLLVVLDLNGTLIHRKRRGLPPSFAKRPGLDDFLDFLFTCPEFKVMVWSSAQPSTVTEVLDRLLDSHHRRQLVATWTRTTLDLTKQQYREKVQVYKRLDKIWNDPTIQAAWPNYNNYWGSSVPKDDPAGWDQTNTLLIDDSATKAVGQPHNIIEIPEFTNDPAVDEEKNLHTVQRQLRLLRYQADVSRKLRQWADRRHEGATTVNPAAVDGFWQRELYLEELALEARKSMPRYSNVDGKSSIPRGERAASGVAHGQGMEEIGSSEDDFEVDVYTQKDQEEAGINSGNDATTKRTPSQRRSERRRRKRLREAGG